MPFLAQKHAERNRHRDKKKHLGTMISRGQEIHVKTMTVNKGGFLSESANRFSYLPKNIPNFYLELS